MGQSIRWIGFVVSNSITRSCVHFFPASDSATAPYPATCKLTLFGRDVLSKSVTLDGGRLGYPDGVRVEDAFPILKGMSGGTFGLELEISTSQPRLDLIGSSCSVDLHSQGMSAHFRPKIVRDGETMRLMNARGESTSLKLDVPKLDLPAESRSIPQSVQLLAAEVANAEDAHGGKVSRISPEADIASRSTSGLRDTSSAAVGVAMLDRFHITSLVVVNRSEKAILTKIKRPDLGGAVTAEVAAQSVSEIALPESFYDGGFEQECGWGSFRCAPIEVLHSFSATSEPHNDDSIAAQSDEVATHNGSVIAHSSLKADLKHRDRTESMREIAQYVVYRDVKSRRIASVVGI